jgi:Domain of unknown function DUF29
MADTSYDTDLYAWTQPQAAALRTKDWSALDLANLAEEIESLGNEQAYAVESHLHIALLHLLKIVYQRQRRQSWLRSINSARNEITRRLKRIPGLRPQLPDLVADAYRTARRTAALEISLPRDTFPESCPWSLAQILDEDFFPEEP